MTPPQLTIRRMTPADCALAIDWAAAEGWNPGLNDADCFYQADPDGFFMAEVDGTPAGFISAVAYNEQFGFVGLYITRPDLRRYGTGMALLHAAQGYLGERTIGADGVLNMVPKYLQIGFCPAHKNARYQGGGVSCASSLADPVDLSFTELEEYDRRFFPASRSSFLQNWINQPGGCFRMVRAGGRMIGYGLMRPCRQGFKIGPLFADSPDIADELYRSLASHATESPVFLDLPVCNKEALALAERYGMTKVFETERIYRGAPPVLPLDQVYGITSFELG